MCFQGWANYACGHTKAFEQTCAYADELDVNFWLKVACPWYSNSSRQLGVSCGKYKYYCADTADGMYLDRIHQRREQSDEKYKELYDLIYNHWGTLLKEKSQAHYKRGGTRAEFLAHPSVQKVQQFMTQLNDQRNDTRRVVERCDFIINEAKKFYQLYGSRPVMQYTTAMSMKPQASAGTSAGAAIGNHAYQAAMASGRSYHEGSHVPPQIQHAPFTTAPMDIRPLLQPQFGNVPGGASAGPHRLGGLYNPSMATMGPGSQSVHSPDVFTVPGQVQESAQKKRGRGKKKVVEEQSPRKEPEGVRRSTCVRGKQVNYAEDLSDISRSSSPNKSDASAFTPSRIEASASPSKAVIPPPKMQSLQDGLGHRGAPSLLDKIGEWKRQGSSLGTPPQLRQTSSQQYFRPSSGRPGSPLKNQNLVGGPIGTPETIVMSDRASSQSPGSALQYQYQAECHQSQAQAGAQNPMAPSQTGGAQQQTWVVDKNGTNPMISAAMAIGGMIQRPSQQRPKPQAVHPSLDYYNYQRLQQSFNSKAGSDQFPAPSQDLSQQPNIKPPMKRTALSPGAGSPEKRRRLSLPSISDPATLEARISHVATPPPEQNAVPSAPMLAPTSANAYSDVAAAEPFPEFDGSHFEENSLM